MTINGQNFTSSTTTTVQFVSQADHSSTQGTNVVVNGAGNSLTVTQPALDVGVYDVTVTTDQGTSAIVPTDQYSVGPVIQFVSPAGGPTAGGTSVTLLGANFGGATAVAFGATTVTSGIVVSPNGSSLTVSSPALKVGIHDITVTSSAGTSVASNAATFTAGATVTSITPSVASSASTTALTVTGGDLDGATAVDIGGTTITAGIEVSADGTTLKVTVPSALAAGTYDVTVVTSANGTSLRSTAAQLVVEPLTIEIYNKTGLGDGVPIYAAIFGQLAFDASTGALDQHPTSTSLQGDHLVEVYFNAAGQYAPTAPLYIGYPAPNFNTVPAFQLAFSNGLATIPLPHVYLNSARIVLGVASAPQATIVDATGAVAAPALGNPDDPNHTIIYDFIELTLNENNILFSNTSQIDQLGIPFTVTVSPADPNVPGGVGVLVSRSDIFGSATTGFQDYLTSVGGGAFAICATEEGSANIGSGSYPYRLLAPADLLGLEPSNALSTYFDGELQTLFNTARTDLVLLVPNPNAGITSGNTVNPGDANLANYTFTGEVSNGTLQFTTTVHTPSGATPVALTVGPPPTSGGSVMVFACNGIFADNVARFGPPTTSLTSMAGLQSSLLANIENQIVSALNRGIVNLPTTGYVNTTLAWAGTQANHNTDHLTYYQKGAIANFYAGYLHAQIGNTDVSKHQLAYGFAYDDQGNQSSTQTSTNPQSMTITLAPWNS